MVLLDARQRAWDNTRTIQSVFGGFFVTQLLMKWFVPNSEDAHNGAVRQCCGRLAGGVGIAVNLLLFVLKLIAGLLTASIAVTADAFNNLSDAGTAIVTMVGFHLAGQEADEEHPFGHGRMEYLAGLIVSLAILLVGFELFKSSVAKIFNPQAVHFSLLSALILVAAVLIKLWLCGFYRKVGGCIDSAALRAAAADSLSDAVATAVVLFSGLAGVWLQLPIDGWVGVLVAAFIFRAGWQAVKETLDPLLGRPMDPELAADIDRLVLDHPYILGIHDVVYHDYGPGRAMMSFHAEVPADGDLLAIHDVIDHIERELKQRNRIETVIHMDPIVRDEKTEELRKRVEGLVKELGPMLTVHDFRITAGPIHTNILFDVVVPYGFSMTDVQVKKELVYRIRALSEKYYPVIEVDRSFVQGEK